MKNEIKKVSFQIEKKDLDTILKMSKNNEKMKKKVKGGFHVPSVVCKVTREFMYVFLTDTKYTISKDKFCIKHNDDSFQSTDIFIFSFDPFEFKVNKNTKSSSSLDSILWEIEEDIERKVYFMNLKSEITNEGISVISPIEDVENILNIFEKQFPSKKDVKIDDEISFMVNARLLKNLLDHYLVNKDDSEIVELKIIDDVIVPLKIVGVGDGAKQRESILCKVKNFKNS